MKITSTVDKKYLLMLLVFGVIIMLLVIYFHFLYSNLVVFIQIGIYLLLHIRVIEIFC